MKAVLVLGKLATLLAWVLMFFNLFSPFEDNIGVILTILLGVTAMMHGLQVLIFHTIFCQLLPLKAKDYLNAFLFGVFALLDYRQRALSQLAAETSANTQD